MKSGPDLFPFRINSNKWIWWPAALISVVLLGFVILQADFDSMVDMIRRINPALLGFAFIFLMLEGIFTAIRIRLFCPSSPCYSEALRANAWYVLMLVILPARLGEVAAIWIFNRYLGMSHGSAAMSIIAQRLYDVAILGAVFIGVLAGLHQAIDREMLTVLALSLFMLAIFFLLYMEFFLALIIKMLKKRRKLSRIFLQARLWVRHGLKTKDIPLAVFWTILKWASNLGALICLFFALNLDLSFIQSVAIAAAYNFMAIVPIQTIGGIGIGDAGLMALLLATGIAIGAAASASLLMRIVILAFPFIFWMIVMSGLHIKKRFTGC